jgi:hypothetical protein
VIDITNLPFIRAGNPELRQQLNNVVGGRYTYNNTSKGLLFVGNVFYQTANDFITNATYIATRDSSINGKIVLAPGQQLSLPVNLDGFRSLRSFINLAFPMRFIRSNLNLNGGLSFNRLPGIINNVLNESKNTTYTAGAVLASNVSQYIDFTVSYTANFNNVQSQLLAQDDNFYQHTAGVSLNLLSKTGWFLQNEVNNQLFTGLAQGFNQNYTLWNAALGKKFLKDQKGELRFSVFDLLRQNQSIVRNVTETFIQDTQNQVLQQYFLVSFFYNLRNFGTAASRAANRAERERGGPEGPPRF